MAGAELHHTRVLLNATMAKGRLEAAKRVLDNGQLDTADKALAAVQLGDGLRRPATNSGINIAGYIAMECSDNPVARVTGTVLRLL
jgi:hypothetical protein